MKSLTILPILLLFLPIIAFGQIAKKNTIFDGGISGVANRLNISDRVELDVRATPSLLYFFSDNFAVGGQLTLGATPDDGGIAGLKLDSRYYFGIIESQAMFLAADIGFTRFDVTTTWSGNLGLGLDYFLTRSIALESVLSFGFSRLKNSFFETRPNQLHLNFSTGLKIFFDGRYDYYKGRETVLKRGTIFIGGTLGSLEVVKMKQERNNGHTIRVVPNIGYLLTERILLGTQFTYFRNKASTGNSKFTQLGVTGFLKYYLTSNVNRGILFVELGGGINKIKQDLGVLGELNNPTAPVYYGNIGIDFFFTPKVAVESKIGWERNDLGNDFILKQGLLDISLQFILGN